MRLQVYCHGSLAGILTEIVPQKSYSFTYAENYTGPAISLTMPIERQTFTYDHFPRVFEGLLPEGIELEALLRFHKILSTDFMTQLLKIGADLTGSLTITTAKEVH